MTWWHGVWHLWPSLYIAIKPSMLMWKPCILVHCEKSMRYPLVSGSMVSGWSAVPGLGLGLRTWSVLSEASPVCSTEDVATMLIRCVNGTLWSSRRGPLPPTSAFFLLKEPTRTFTIVNLLSHYTGCRIFADADKQTYHTYVYLLCLNSHVA